ncbi:prefoldin subunit 5, partial [Chelonoidis abingdonii]|uniref:prefoldin subunit 5 n=1 Tax=Chelonoidis abingdonii TaxID=106734 RepID=UPI003F494479
CAVAVLSPQEGSSLAFPIAQLKLVQTKYVEPRTVLNCLNKSNMKVGKELLVPLTSSMYVPGKLSDVGYVLVDVGTGYYVEKTADNARDFFKRKIDFLTKQMEKIQPALQEKHAMKQAVMEMMSQKIQQLTAMGASQAAATKA